MKNQTYQGLVNIQGAPVKGDIVMNIFIELSGNDECEINYKAYTGT